MNQMNFGSYSLKDLYSPHSGVISFFYSFPKELSRPDTFNVIAKSADLKAYGYPISHTSVGAGAALAYKDACYAAFGETMERYCLAVVHPEDIIVSTYNELVQKGLPATAPGDWSLFDDKQDIGPFARFNGDTKIGWVLADSLADKQSRYVPATFAYLPYLTMEEDEQTISVSVSTGAACARTKAEGILKGICELVERDAFMIVWKNQLAIPLVRIDEKSSIYQLYKEKFERQGIEYRIYCTTLDLKIPSFLGILSGISDDGQRWHIAGGAAHPDPEKAVLKTLIELTQGLAWKDYKGDMSFPFEEDFSNVDSFEKRLELYAYNDLSEAFAFLPDQPTVNLSDMSTSYGYTDTDIPATLQQVIADFKAKGYDVLAIDATTTEAYEAGVFITRVMIPALEVMDGDFRFQYLGGKRWKELPAKLNKRKYAPDVALNPYPHPYP